MQTDHEAFARATSLERATHARPRRASFVAMMAAVIVLGAVTGSGVSAHGEGLSSDGSSPPAASDVLDLAEIQAGDIEVELDPSGTAATIRLETTIDAACAVVFGEDETLGRLALDQDMGGAAHSQHSVVLGGLAPSTSYVFRLQGSGIDGHLYRSDLLSFTTSTPTGERRANAAEGARIVEVSSEYSPVFAALHAVDGDPTTAWSSSGDGDDAFITLDLGEPVDIEGIAFETREMTDGTAVTHTFTVTADGESYGPYPALDEVPLAITAQVLRFDVDTSSGGNTGAVEILVYRRDPSAQ